MDDVVKQIQDVREQVKDLNTVIKAQIDQAHARGREFGQREGRLEVMEALTPVLVQAVEHQWSLLMVVRSVKAVCDSFLMHT